MNRKNRTLLAMAIALTASGCAMAPLSERAFKQKLHIAKDANGEGIAQVEFSADKKYETSQGVPLVGDPVICGREGIFRVNEDNLRKDQIKVKANEEIAVTSVIQWENTGWTKTCWPFVAFTPESGAKYIVVNERIGGKGWSALWTGVAFQTCQVSVYQETQTGFQRVQTRVPPTGICRTNKQ